MIFDSINNYIIIDNSKIKDYQFKDKIEINDNSIIINDATNIQIIYNLDQDYNQFNIINNSNNLDLIEQYNVNNDITINSEINLSKDTNITRYVEINSSNNIVFNSTISSDENSKIKQAFVDLSKANIKSNILCELNKQGSECLTRLAVLAKDKEEKHYVVTLNHNDKDTYGNMDNFGVVQSGGNLIIDGIGRIKKGNSHSSSHQTNKIIVFDKGCVAKANPYLYIDEYDVEASHGASVGQIDEDHLYYLQSRGLNKKQAMELVTYGYFIPVVEYINNDQLKEHFSNILKEKVGL